MTMIKRDATYDMWFAENKLNVLLCFACSIYLSVSNKRAL